jgi:hypothetical protein
VIKLISLFLFIPLILPVLAQAREVTELNTQVSFWSQIPRGSELQQKINRENNDRAYKDALDRAMASLEISCVNGALDIVALKKLPTENPPRGCDSAHGCESIDVDVKALCIRNTK